MYISHYALDLLIKAATPHTEYHGTHGAHTNTLPSNPNATPAQIKAHKLWGLCAYWRINIPAKGIYLKITHPVKSFKPSKATLDRALKAALKERIDAIQIILDTTHYGQMFINEIDPSGVKPLIAHLLDGQYYDLLERKLEQVHVVSVSTAGTANEEEEGYLSAFYNPKGHYKKIRREPNGEVSATHDLVNWFRIV